MAKESVRKGNAKKQGKTLKEKRAAKKTKRSDKRASLISPAEH